MKKLILLLLLIPCMSFGQNESLLNRDKQAHLAVGAGLTIATECLLDRTDLREDYKALAQVFIPMAFGFAKEFYDQKYRGGFGVYDLRATFYGVVLGTCIIVPIREFKDKKQLKL